MFDAEGLAACPSASTCANGTMQLRLFRQKAHGRGQALPGPYLPVIHGCKTVGGCPVGLCERAGQHPQSRCIALPLMCCTGCFASLCMAQSLRSAAPPTCRSHQPGMTSCNGCVANLSTWVTEEAPPLLHVGHTSLA